MYTQQILLGVAVGQAPAPTPMQITIDTTLQANLVMLLPIRGNTNIVINWGDGGANTTIVSANRTTNASKTYSANGNYTISISGTLQQYGDGPIQPGTNQKITGVISFGDLNLQSLWGAFRQATNLTTTIPSTLPSTVANLNRTFQGASNFNGNINSWNTSNVTDMSGMIATASNFNGNINSWNTSNVTDMSDMFNSASIFNQDISSWNTSNVTNMNSMFRFSTDFNQNLSSWVTGLTSQPTFFSQSANAVFANNASNLKPYLQDGVTRINT